MLIKKYILLTFIILTVIALGFTGSYYIQKKGVQETSKITTPLTYIARTLTVHGLGLSTSTTEELNIICNDNTEKELENHTIIPCSNLYTSSSTTPKIMIGTTKLDLSYPKLPEILSSITFQIHKPQKQEGGPVVTCNKVESSTVSSDITADNYQCFKGTETLVLRVYLNKSQPLTAIWSVVFSNEMELQNEIIEKISRISFFVDKAYAQDAGDSTGGEGSHGGMDCYERAIAEGRDLSTCQGYVAPVTCTKEVNVPHTTTTGCDIHTVTHSVFHCSDGSSHEGEEWAEYVPPQWSTVDSPQCRPVTPVTPPTPTVTWSEPYCTGPNDVNHPNQMWRCTVENPGICEYTGTSCPVTPEPVTPSGCGPNTLNDTCGTWVRYCTGPNDPYGHINQVWEHNSSLPDANAWRAFVPAEECHMPTITAYRDPDHGVPGDRLTTTWNSTYATSTSYVCTGPYTHAATLQPSGAIPDTYLADWLGMTTCNWTAWGQWGQAHVTEYFTVSLPNGCGPGTLNNMCTPESCTSNMRWTGTTCVILPDGCGPLTNNHTCPPTDCPSGSVPVNGVCTNLVHGCGAGTLNNTCPPLSSTGLTISASPKTLTNPGNVSISFSITSPTTRCAIRAVPYITDDPTHQAARNADAAAITSLLFATTTTKTDLNDPYNGPSFPTGRFLSTAFSQADPVTGDGKARGKKTVQVNYSTLFQMSCDNWSTMKSQVVQLTREKEI